MRYTIAKGDHFSGPRTNILPINCGGVEATWIFDTTVKYKPADAENDWNKLFGIWFTPPVLWAIRNPLKVTRYNCCMVAFRWKDNQLELAPYLHRKGSMEYAELLKVDPVVCEIGGMIYTKIELSDTSVLFTIGSQKFCFTFPSHNKIAFAVQPYFGGQATAPNDIFIEKL